MGVVAMLVTFWAALALVAFGVVYGTLAVLQRSRPCRTCGRPMP